MHIMSNMLSFLRRGFSYLWRICLNLVFSDVCDLDSLDMIGVGIWVVEAWKDRVILIVDGLDIVLVVMGMVKNVISRGRGRVGGLQDLVDNLTKGVGVLDLRDDRLVDDGAMDGFNLVGVAGMPVVELWLDVNRLMMNCLVIVHDMRLFIGWLLNDLCSSGCIRTDLSSSVLVIICCAANGSDSWLLIFCRLMVLELLQGTTVELLLPLASLVTGTFLFDIALFRFIVERRSFAGSPEFGLSISHSAFCMLIRCLIHNNLGVLLSSFRLIETVLNFALWGSSFCLSLHLSRSLHLKMDIG